MTEVRGIHSDLEYPVDDLQEFSLEVVRDALENWLEGVKFTSFASTPSNHQNPFFELFRDD